MPWSTSGRRTELPPNWPAIRRQVLTRDRYCCQWSGCTARATDVDHKRDRSSHDPADLQSLCADHHKVKTTGEGHAAMRAIRAKAKHPTEAHPALRRGRYEPPPF